MSNIKVHHELISPKVAEDGFSRLASIGLQSYSPPRQKGATTLKLHYYVLILFMLVGANSAMAQSDKPAPAPATQSQSPAAAPIPAANPADVASIDAIVAALYDVISGPAGKKRDWDRMRSL